MRKRMLRGPLLGLLALVLGLGLGARAGELRVPVDYPTIQAALDAASPGDRITIAPGTYVENLTIGKRDLTLAGADPATVIVQAKFPDLPVVTIRERNITLLGLTLTAGQRGVKIESRADNGVLANLVIQGNEDEGLVVDGGRDGEVRRCTITGNGKGVYVGNRGSLRLQGNRISENGAGIEAVDANRLELRENLVRGNRGCGLNTDPATQLVGLNNVITGNGTDLCGAAQGRTDLLDQTPPPAPRNLTVKPEGWTNLGRFTLDWTHCKARGLDELGPVHPGLDRSRGPGRDRRLLVQGGRSSRYAHGRDTPGDPRKALGPREPARGRATSVYLA